MNKNVEIVPGLTELTGTVHEAIDWSLIKPGTYLEEDRFQKFTYCEDCIDCAEKRSNAKDAADGDELGAYRLMALTDHPCNDAQYCGDCGSTIFIQPSKLFTQSSLLHLSTLIKDSDLEDLSNNHLYFLYEALSFCDENLKLNSDPEINMNQVDRAILAMAEEFMLNYKSSLIIGTQNTSKSKLRTVF